MKKIIHLGLWALCISALLNLSACDKLKEAAKVNLNLSNNDGNFTIPIILNTGQQNVGVDEIYINLDSLIKAQNSKVGANNIREVKITKCQLDLSNGDAENNFSALQSCSMEIKSNVNTAYIKIAGINDNPDVESQSLNLPVESQLDLKDYFLSAHTFGLQLSANARKTTTKELQCQVTIHYTLVAGL